jgi:hypothetical protein
MEQARKGIPVTTQRRFDVYADISECTDAKNIDYS